MPQIAPVASITDGVNQITSVAGPVPRLFERSGTDEQRNVSSAVGGAIENITVSVTPVRAWPTGRRLAEPAARGTIKAPMSETQFYVSVAVVPSVTVIIVLVGVLLNNTNMNARFSDMSGRFSAR